MGCDLGRDPVGAVVADDADDVAAGEPKLEQAEREVAHAGLIVVPGKHAPEAKVFFAERDLVAMLARVQSQQFWIGVGSRNPPGIIHHAALSAGMGVSSGS